MDDSHEKSSPSTSNIIPSSHNSIKSMSLNILSNNSFNLNDGKIIDNENIYSDKDLNEKIIKLLIGDHPLLPMKAIEKIAHCNFMNQHYKNKDFYNIKVIDEIIHNENSHIVAEFKDYLIKGDISEFLQQYYKKKESLNLLPKIYEYYISCSVIFPNYVILPESQYIYKNIQRKQRVIDIQQEQEDKEENIKNGLIEQEKEPTIFNTQAFDSILNQTDTSGIKQYFGISRDVSKGGGDEEMMKLLNNIDNAEKKTNLNNNNNKKHKINVCKLKKGNNNDIFQYQNTMLLNEGGYNKKIKSAFHNKESDTGFFDRKNSGYINNKHNQNWNKNNLKQILRQCTENNNNHYKKKNNFSTQITYIDSCNNHMKNVFDLKGIESIKKIKRNSKNIKDNKNEKDTVKQLFKNNSQSYGSLKHMNSKEKNLDTYYIKGNKDKENINQYNLSNKNISGNLSINQSENKNIKNDKNNNQHKEIMSRNNELLNIDNNIKTYFKEPVKKIAQTKNTITSYKTKSQNKHKSKGYQTSRNKYDNKNMYINISKSNISKNHQSIDSDINNNHIIKKAMNQIQNKHNNIKNNLINALLGAGNNNQKKKITKYKDILIQKDSNSIVDSIDLKNINIKPNNVNFDININNNEKINIENIENEIDINNNDNPQEYDNNNINNIFLYNNNEKNNIQNKRIISSSNLESNNKFSSTSLAKTMSINSYGHKPKNTCSNINNTNHKKQISTSKIPTSFQDNKISSNIKNKKNNKIIEDIDNKNKLKEYIDNYLDDYFSSKINNNFNRTQTKNLNQEECNNYINNNNNNININNYFIDTKNRTKNRGKNEIFSSIKNIKEKKKEKDDNYKIRNSIFNFEKRISKKLSEKNLNIFDKIKTKSSPKNNSTKKTSSVRTNKSGNIQSCEHGPLSARESNKYQINAEMIELLSNKIQKIKQSIKETSDKGSNSISSIFKKKKIPSAGRKPVIPVTKKSEEFIEKKTQNASKTRNKKSNNALIGTVSSNSNIGISGNLVNTIINSIYQTNLLSPNKKNSEYDKLMKTFQKFKRPTSSFTGNNNSNNSKNSKSNYNISNNNNNSNNPNILSKKDSQKKKKHGRCNSIYSTSNNYDNHFNIEVNIKNNLRVQSKKSINNMNNKNQNDNLNSLNINFNNYTNNYNYNYNINSINNINNNNVNNVNNVNNGNINFSNNNINYNSSVINKGKSNSQKIIMGKVVNKNENNFKGIPINGFEKLITKKYNTRNYNIPMSVTDRLKQTNMYSTSTANNNTNSYRYKNSKSRHVNNNRAYNYKK